MAALPNENEGYPREEIYGGTLDAEPCYEDMDDADFQALAEMDHSLPLTADQQGQLSAAAAVAAGQQSQPAVLGALLRA